MNAEEFIEAYARCLCEHCAGKTPFVELHQGRYHTKKGEGPAYRNERCRAADFKHTASRIIAEAKP